MEKSVFEPGNVFRFSECVDYSVEGIISKRVLDKPVGTVTLFSFDKGQRLSTHSAPFDAMVQVIWAIGRGSFGSCRSVACRVQVAEYQALWSAAA